MRIEQQTIALTVDDSLIRLHVARPVGEGCWPGILFYSDIYQLGDPIQRLANRLAGYGFVVAAPEIFHRIEPIGTVLQPDAIGRLRGNDDARRTAIRSYDADARAVCPGLPPTLASILPFGCARLLHWAIWPSALLSIQVKATVCIYPTGLQNGQWMWSG